MFLLRISQNKQWTEVFPIFVIGVMLVFAEVWGAQAQIPKGLRVTDVSISGKTGKSADIGLGERLQIELKGPKGSVVDTNEFTLKSLILYLDNRPIGGQLLDVDPKFAASCIEQETSRIAVINQKIQDAKEDEKKIEELKGRRANVQKRRGRCGDTALLTFELARDQDNDDSRKVWSALLGSPKSLNRTVKVDVGLPGGERILVRNGVKAEINLEMLGGVSLTVAFLMFFLALGFFVLLCNVGKIIREAPAPALPTKSKPPYSLGKTQMAWWFFLVLGSYLFIAVATLNYETISAQALILIGIAGGTGLGAIAIDSRKKDTTASELTNANSELVKLQGKNKERKNEQSTLKAIKVLTPEQAARLVSVSAEITEIDAKQLQITMQIASLNMRLLGPVSRNFWMDLVSDSEGVSFHRFQNVIWSVVLGAVFLFQVWRNLAMPEFSATLLSLMGITSVTYLGFKFPEKKV